MLQTMEPLKGCKSDTNFFHRVGQNWHFSLGANGRGLDLQNTQPREKSYVTWDTPLMIVALQR